MKPLLWVQLRNLINYYEDDNFEERFTFKNRNLQYTI